jgi:hypothetical protein
LTKAIVHGHIEVVGRLLQYANESVSFLIYYEIFNDNQRFSEFELADKLRQTLRPNSYIGIFKLAYEVLRRG